MAKSIHKTTRRCPICNQPATAEAAPFCSSRCADTDLSRWLGEVYSVPTDERDDAQTETPDEGED